MYQIKLVEKIKSHILCSVTFYKNRVMYEIKWKNIVEIDRLTDDFIIWRMRFAYWIFNARDSHSEYVIIIASPR
jgi:hypothetical protein